MSRTVAPAHSTGEDHPHTSIGPGPVPIRHSAASWIARATSPFAYASASTDLVAVREPGRDRGGEHRTAALRVAAGDAAARS